MDRRVYLTRCGAVSRGSVVSLRSTVCSTMISIQSKSENDGLPKNCITRPAL
jgi:hypothetical protein